MNPAGSGELPLGEPPVDGIRVNRLAVPLGRHLAEVLESGSLGRWAQAVQAWWGSPAGRACVRAIEARQATGATVYPHEVLRALTLTPLDAVRVLILGQDPYHGPGQAQGLAFSVPAGTRLPPSLRHIVQEVRRDTGDIDPLAASGDLSVWARQGVLLLNASFTVEEGAAGAHARLGWAGLTEALLRALAEDIRASGRPLAALLWGAHAQAWAPLLEGQVPRPQLCLLQANHPSPLSARRPPHPFLGCGHFSQASRFLADQDPHRPPLRW